MPKSHKQNKIFCRGTTIDVVITGIHYELLLIVLAIALRLPHINIFQMSVGLLLCSYQNIFINIARLEKRALGAESDACVIEHVYVCMCLATVGDTMPLVRTFHTYFSFSFYGLRYGRRYARTHIPQ